MGMGLIRGHRTLLLALAAVLTLVAPVARAQAAPIDITAASAQVEPAVVRIDTAVDYQGVIGLGTGFVI
ncbi:serine protease, partial [Mycobacterium sp. ITM-2017-0098]